MNPLYNAGIKLYAAAAKAAALRSAKAAAMVRGHKDTLTLIRRSISPEDAPVWIHAASLGEFEQGRPLIERLRREHPEKKIVLTFFSPSGYEIRKNYDKADVVAYLPFDTPANARAFIDALHPSVAIFVKYEIWGNYLSELRRRGIPAYLISAIFRDSQIYFRSYGTMMRNILPYFTGIYLQDRHSEELLRSIGITDVKIAGDTRFDRVTDIMAAGIDIPGMDSFRPQIVFGSSWQPDEEGYIPLLNERQDVRFILAPHEFDSRRIKELTGKITGKVVPYSQWERMVANGEDISDVRGIVVDCFGKLSSLYRYGKIAYIGGGFGAGIHNINEAAVYGIPVIFGPKYRKFKEACDLIAEGGAVSCAETSEIAPAIAEFLDDAEARESAGKVAGEYIRRNLGATDIIYNDIFS